MLTSGLCADVDLFPNYMFVNNIDSRHFFFFCFFFLLSVASSVPVPTGSEGTAEIDVKRVMAAVFEGFLSGCF